MNETLKEAKRLYDMGFAIHWLHERSKVPVEHGWGSGPRKKWSELKETYVKGYNVGVRLGTPSKISEGFLAVIDVDVKSTDPKHKKEAYDAVSKLVIRGNACPIVTSGRGNGSRHYYCITQEPFKTFNAAQSADIVRVHMPSKLRVSKREREELTDEEIKKGIRLSHAWEISLYSDGRQVVLPPSVHPDSGKRYAWVKAFGSVDLLPMLPIESMAVSTGGKAGKTSRDQSASRSNEQRVRSDLSDFKPTSVMLDWLDLPESTVKLITKGMWRGRLVENRSDYLLVACSSLLAHGLGKDDILTILTERDYFLGECAYDHAQTDNRARAAKWVWKYTLEKVMQKNDVRQRFLDEPIEEDLPEREAKKQDEAEAEEQGWSSRLDRTQNGILNATLANCKAILEHSCKVTGFVGRDEFAANDFYLVDAPWRSKKGDAVTDVDIHRIKFWLAENWGAEFNNIDIDFTLREIADKNRYHPVRNWLRSLTWDGIERIGTWLKDYAGAEGPDAYVEAVSRKVLIAMVKRVFEPGCKFDHVLILEGLQGIGKSTLLKNLAGDQWFSDAKLDIGDKDAVMTMQSRWLIELGELSAMRRAETEELKAFITQTTDRIRVPYGKRTEDFPRQCVFIGSTNNEEYLVDLTGNRRFWPVLLSGKVRFNDIDDVREQLFAEALQAYEWGESLYLDDEEAAALAVVEQAKRQYSDEWQGTIAKIIGDEMFPRKAFEVVDVARRLGIDIKHVSQSEVQRITRCLKALGALNWREGGGDRRRLWRIGGHVQGRPASSTATSVVTKHRNREVIFDFS